MTTPTPITNDLSRCASCNGGTGSLVSWAAEEITTEQAATLPAGAGVAMLDPDDGIVAYCRDCLMDMDSEEDTELEEPVERTEPMDHQSTWYAMRVGRSIRPTEPERSEFFDDCLSLMVLDLGGVGERRDLRAFTTYGTPDVIAGDTILLVSSSPNARRVGRMSWDGKARVVAVRYAGGKVSGVLPTGAMPHLVAK